MSVPSRFRHAAVWSAAALAVLVVPGWIAPDPPAVVAALNALVHLALFAGLVTLWARTVPRLRPVVLVVAVFVAVGVEAVQAEPSSAWAVQARTLWADLAGIALGWLLDRTYRRRPLPGLPFPLPRQDLGDAPPAGPHGDRPARTGNAPRAAHAARRPQRD